MVWLFLPFLQYFKQFNVFGDIPELQIWQLYESYEKYPPCMPELCWSNALIGYPIFTDLASTFKSPLNHLKSLFHEMPNLALDTDRENKRTRFFFFLSLPKLIPRASHEKKDIVFSYIHLRPLMWKWKEFLGLIFFFLKRLTYYE